MLKPNANNTSAIKPNTDASKSVDDFLAKYGSKSKDTKSRSHSNTSSNVSNTSSMIA